MEASTTGLTQAKEAILHASILAALLRAPHPPHTADTQTLTLADKLNASRRAESPRKRVSECELTRYRRDRERLARATSDSLRAIAGGMMRPEETAPPSTLKRAAAVRRLATDKILQHKITPLADTASANTKNTASANSAATTAENSENTTTADTPSHLKLVTTRPPAIKPRLSRRERQRLKTAEQASDDE